MGTYLHISQKGSLKHLETANVFTTKHVSRNVAAFILRLFQVVYILFVRILYLLHNRCLNVTSGIWRSVTCLCSFVISFGQKVYFFCCRQWRHVGQALHPDRQPRQH